MSMYEETETMVDVANEAIEETEQVPEIPYEAEKTYSKRDIKVAVGTGVVIGAGAGVAATIVYNKKLKPLREEMREKRKAKREAKKAAKAAAREARKLGKTAEEE